MAKDSIHQQHFGKVATAISALLERSKIVDERKFLLRVVDCESVVSHPRCLRACTLVELS